MTFRTTYHARQRYTLRILGCLAFTLLLLIALVRFWPAGSGGAPDALFSDTGPETIQIEEVQPTSQPLEKRPPPPAPLPPVVVPDEKILETEPVEFLDASLLIDDPGEDEQLQEGTDREAATRRPDVNARLLRYVEPEYTRAARRRNVRAEVLVEVHVSAQGRVQSAAILKRRLLGADGEPARTVNELGYGLEEAALSAAEACLFRPARAGGRPVSTRTTLTIRFDS